MSEFDSGFDLGFGPLPGMSGILGQLDLAPGVETLLYVPGATTRASVKVVFTNRNPGTSIECRVILRPGAGPSTPANFLAFDEVIPVKESRVSAVFDMENPQELLVQCDTANVTANANGIERDI